MTNSILNWIFRHCLCSLQKLDFPKIKYRWIGRLGHLNFERNVFANMAAKIGGKGWGGGGSDGHAECHVVGLQRQFGLICIDGNLSRLCRGPKDK